MIVEEQIVTLAGWATDVVCIDDPKSTPHTLIVFVPGNPGCIGWYTSHLLELVQRLPEGVAARGASYAGHSPHTLPQGSDISISWTVNGQIQHKCAFLDWILSEFETWPRLIFMSHSIGSHMVERLLLLRPDVLRQTRGVIHLMPFTRMKASLWDQSRLDWGAARPELLIRYSGWASQLLQRLPRWLVDYCMKGIMDDAKARDLAVSLLRQPNYPRTFFELGTEEIRDVPEIGDGGIATLPLVLTIVSPQVSALQLIASHCPMAMLYAGHDQWAPRFHMLDLQKFQQRKVIPSTISFTYRSELRHDYVSYGNMVPTVVHWCFKTIQTMLNEPPTIRSKL